MLRKAQAAALSNQSPTGVETGENDFHEDGLPLFSVVDTGGSSFEEVMLSEELELLDDRLSLLDQRERKVIIAPLRTKRCEANDA